jgi:DNA-binding winged helix-turn-helix (wHTH) protein
MQETSGGDEASTHEEALRIGEFTLDLRRRGLFRSSERIHLTPKPFEVLVYLVLGRGRVVSKTELLNAVWQGHQDDNVVEQAVRQIRRALNEDKTKPRFIQTLSGQGYCFIGNDHSERSIAAMPAALDSAPVNAQTRITQRSVTKYWRFGAAGLACFVLLGAIAFRPFLPDPKLANPVRITRLQARILSPMLTDGSRLYFQRFDNGRYMVAEVAASGGETIGPAMGISNPELCDIAPDGESLLVRDLVHSREDIEPVYIQPVVGGNIHRVGEILAYDVAWYPDGQHLLYSAGGSIYRTNVDGGSRKRLFGVSGNAYWFRWSPDGRTLRFTLIDAKSEATSLWEVPADSTTPHRLHPDSQYPQCCGSWTPDGKYFLFQVRVESAFQIWSSRERGSLLFRTSSRGVPLAVGPMNYRGPVPSKDGKKLFMRAEAPKGQLVRYDSRSGQFITLLPSISARTATYSRDEKWIAYTSLADNNLWRCKSDGGDCLELAYGMQQTALPRWSPDGKTIAFMARHFGEKWGLFGLHQLVGISVPFPTAIPATAIRIGLPMAQSWFLAICSNLRSLPR